MWCDEDENQGNLHTNYKLSNGGEQVLLFNPDSLLVDETSFGDMYPDVSWERMPNGTGPFVYLWPTFGAYNGQVSVAENTGATDLVLYPNPSNGTVNLSNVPLGTAINVFDALGRQVFSTTASGPVQFDTTLWPNGTYSVRCDGRALPLSVIH